MTLTKCYVVLVLLVIVSLKRTTSSECSRTTTCVDCDRVLDASGSHSCSWCVSSQSCVPQYGLECVFGDKIAEEDDCPILEAPGVYYNDTFARNEMFAISAATYWDTPQTCMDNFIEGAVVRKQVKVPCDPSGSTTDLCSAFTAVSTRRKAMILGFRGTDGSIQLLIEGWETVLDAKTDVPGGGQVSKYFFNAFYSVWKGGIEEDFLDMVKSYSGYEVWISGHSLGGAAASIAASVIAHSGYYDGKFIKLVTFGQPRTGDHKFVAAHDKAILYTYRVVHHRDLVVHLPTRDFRSYHHHRYEIWYDNDMSDSTYLECYTPDDDSCSDRNYLDMSVNDHLTYFGKSITWIGGTGCIEQS